MNVVLNPEILFIDDEKWGVEEQRDLFLSRLFGILDYIYMYPQMSIYWNEDFELLLWDAPIQHPWRVDQDFRVPMVNSIRERLVKSRKDIEDAILWDPCNTNSEEPLCEEILQMMHYCLDKSEKVYFATKEKQKNELIFSCEHSMEDTPYVVIDRNDFLQKRQIVEELWPNSLGEKKNFEMIVSLFASEEESEQLLHKYEFTDSFIRSIINYKHMGDTIVNQIVKRLRMDLRKAESDPSLHDELVEGSKEKERRMRVTGRPTSTRIHYVFEERKKISFICFYGPGEHDKGLR